MRPSNNNSRPGSKSHQQQQQPRDPNLICRDFLRNVCRRGNKCKFRHQQEERQFESAPQTQILQVRKDFNKGQRELCFDYENQEITCD